MAIRKRLPSPVKIAIWVVLVPLVVAALFLLFEWAGGLLDSGGVVG